MIFHCMIVWIGVVLLFLKFYFQLKEKKIGIIFPDNKWEIIGLHAQWSIQHNSESNLIDIIFDAVVQKSKTIFDKAFLSIK